MEQTVQNLFDKTLEEHNVEGLHALGIDVLQVNIGLRCNQKCSHCHVASSPDREEIMSWETMEDIFTAAEKSRPSLIDITGGEPETHPHIREFISRFRKNSISVQVRTNLTILTESPYREIVDFFRNMEVRLVGSLPCYSAENVDHQRGEGTFAKSIKGLKLLNSYGYGIKKELPLDLVYNPGGASLPPAQKTLENAYRKELGEKHGVSFTNLFTITNMPLGRFAGTLKNENKLEEYNRLLYNSFNSETLAGLMCKHQMNIGWDGQLYDCDFNFVLGLNVHEGLPATIKDFEPNDYINRKIVTGAHCFGCTAGCGSSCGGALI